MGFDSFDYGYTRTNRKETIAQLGSGARPVEIDAFSFIAPTPVSRSSQSSRASPEDPHGLNGRANEGSTAA